MFDYEEYKAGIENIYYQLDVIDKQISCLGNEGFDNIVRRLGNTLTGIFNTFKTITTKFHKSTKRGELRWYKESNLFTTKKIAKFTYTELMYLKLPIPRGMKSTYTQYTDALTSSLENINMSPLVSLFGAAIKDIHDTILSGEFDINKNISSMNNLFDQKVLSIIERTMNKVDNPKYKILEKEYGELFKSTKEFEDLFARLLDMEKYYDETNCITTKLDKIEKYIQNIIESKQLENINKANLKSLSDVIYRYAKAFDIYGALVYNLQRIEHNFVECLKVIATEKHIT